MNVGDRTTETKPNAQTSSSKSETAVLLAGCLIVLGGILSGLMTSCASRTGSPSDDEKAASAQDHPEATTKSTAGRLPTLQHKPLDTKNPTLWIPSSLRHIIEPSMLGHGAEMETLMWSSLMLDFDTVERIASRLAAPPAVARPGPTDSETPNAMLPLAFYDRQDTLRAAAKELQRVAKARDAEGLAVKVSAVVGTCISCHALFNEPPN